METSNYNLTDAQKESCAINTMRDAVRKLSLRDGIPYEEALLRFTSSVISKTSFDMDEAIQNFKIGVVSSVIDLSDF